MMFKTSTLKSICPISHNFKKISLFKILFILFLLGMVYGALLIGLNQNKLSNNFNLCAKIFNNTSKINSISENFFTSISGEFIIIISLFLIGFLPIGQVVAIWFPIFHGLGLGLFSAYLYSSKGLYGVLYCLVMIAPTALFSVIAILLSSKECMRFSNKNFKILFPEKFELSMHGELKKYCIRFAIFAGIQLFAALTNSIIVFSFSKIFKI